MLTRQEIFDRVCEHAMTQKVKSGVCEPTYSNKNAFKCMYRGPNSTKCFIGIFIPDDRYEEEFDRANLTVNQLPDRAIHKISYNDRDFCSRLQKIHDLRQVENWKQALLDIGASECLDIPEILMA